MSPKPTDSKVTLATAAPPASSTATGQRDRQTATIQYLDRADMEETFADPINRLFFDGQTLRIEFGVTRMDDVKAGAPITGRRYPACRLVLPPAAAVDFIKPHAADRSGAYVGWCGQGCPAAERGPERRMRLISVLLTYRTCCAGVAEYIKNDSGRPLRPDVH